MKKMFILILTMSAIVFSQGITERSYNCIFNVGTYNTWEAKGAQASDEVDALFDKAGLTSSDARKANLYTNSLFMCNNHQTFTVQKSDEEGYIHIIHKATGKAITVDDASKGAGANVLPFNFSGLDHQKFKIVRDTTKHRYAGYIIAKHSGMVLTVEEKGNIVQKPLEDGNEAQIWAFSERNVWHNGKGYLTVKGLMIMPGAKVAQGGKKNSSWCYIAHPTASNLYYIMNTMSHQFMMTAEAVDKENLLPKYTLIQHPYRKGIKNHMLFKMSYSDDTKSSFNIYDPFTLYNVDVDPATKQAILIPREQLSEAAKWKLYNAPKGL